MLTGKTVRKEYELSVLAQSTIITKQNVNKTLENNLKRYTDKTAIRKLSKTKQNKSTTDRLCKLLLILMLHINSTSSYESIL